MAAAIIRRPSARDRLSRFRSGFSPLLVLCQRFPRTTTPFTYSPFPPLDRSKRLAFKVRLREPLHVIKLVVGAFEVTTPAGASFVIRVRHPRDDFFHAEAAQVLGLLLGDG